MFLHVNKDFNDFQRHVLEMVLGRGVTSQEDISEAIAEISKVIEDLTLQNWMPNREAGDQVIKPNHYDRFAMEPTYFIVTSGGYHWNIENFIKYMARYPFKNGVEDLRKAMRNLEMFYRERAGNPRWSC